MLKTDFILALARKNRGMVTASQVAAKGLPRGCLHYLVAWGRLEKMARGVYVLPKQWGDEFVSLQSRLARGIFSGETALFLLGLTDRTPSNFEMTFPATYNLTRAKQEGVRCVQAVPALYRRGIIRVKTPTGGKVAAYCPERVLCDILRPRSKVDVQGVSQAYKAYMARKDKNIPLLSDFAKRLKVDRKLRSYLEVLL